ncbi:MAG: hypothetical protein EBU14_14325 [Acetobacteraceae bacterium]|nr:hypothetical protein [Acetobacteraceae bacterium]
MVRNMLSPMRNFISDAVQMVFKRLESFFTMIYYAFIKIMVAMKRSIANLHMILYTLEAAQMTVRSLWDGPIGGACRAKRGGGGKGLAAGQTHHTPEDGVRMAGNQPGRSIFKPGGITSKRGKYKQTKALERFR